MNLSGLQNVTARGAAGLFLLAGLLLLAPASAFAHAKLLRSLPKSNETAAAATPLPPPAGATQATPAGPAAGVRPDEPEAAGAKDEGRIETAAAAGESTITWLDNLVRRLAYLAMMTLFGGFATRLFVLGPAFEGDGNGDAKTAAARRTVSLLRAGVALLLPTLLVALALQSSSTP